MMPLDDGITPDPALLDTPKTRREVRRLLEEARVASQKKHHLVPASYLRNWARGGMIKFELLADLDDQPAGATVVFDGCNELGATNLRGTGFAVRDIEVRQLRARVGGVDQVAEINVTGLGGFLMAKCAAAYSRRKPKDWYDIAYVLLHNDAGGVEAAADIVLARFGSELASVRTALDDLRDNFADVAALTGSTKGSVTCRNGG